MAPAPDVFVPVSYTLDELQHFSGRDIPRARVSGSGGLVGAHLPRKSASGVPTERWQERRQRVSRPSALETCREPGHSLTRTSRDPRLFWGTVSWQEAGTSEKGICQSDAEQSIRSATEHGRMPGHRHWAGTAT